MTELTPELIELLEEIQSVTRQRSKNWSAYGPIDAGLEAVHVARIRTIQAEIEAIDEQQRLFPARRVVESENTPAGHRTIAKPGGCRWLAGKLRKLFRRDAA